MCVQMEVEPSISAVQVLQGILAAMALNRALIAVHFANMDGSNNNAAAASDAK